MGRDCVTDAGPCWSKGGIVAKPAQRGSMGGKWHRLVHNDKYLGRIPVFNPKYFPRCSNQEDPYPLHTLGIYLCRDGGESQMLCRNCKLARFADDLVVLYNSKTGRPVRVISTYSNF